MLYNDESIILGSVLKYGKAAAMVLLPQLHNSRFVYEMDGSFGLTHSVIWEQIEEIYHRGEIPNYVNVVAVLPEYQDYLDNLIKRMTAQYHIYDLDESLLLKLGQKVDISGMVYEIASNSRVLSDIIGDTNSFDHYINGIDDPAKWAADNVNKFNMRMWDNRGYTTAGDIVDELRDKWTAQRSGVNITLLPCGMPILESYKLFPQGKMAVLHGLSGNGKSSFTFQVLLGTALGMVANGTTGCVAVNSLEMTRQELIESMVATLARVDTSKLINNSLSQEEFDRLFLWSEVVARLPIYVDDTNFITTTAMSFASSGLHVTHGPVRMLVSDYGELFGDNEGKNEELRIAKIFREQFYISRRLGTAVLAISQSTQDPTSPKESRIAGADGTRQSRAVLMATDILAEVYNPPAIRSTQRHIVVPDNMNPDFAYLLIQKYRGGATGGKIPLGWVPEYTSFWDTSLTQYPGSEVFLTNIEAALLAMNLNPVNYGFVYATAAF